MTPQPNLLEPYLMLAGFSALLTFISIPIIRGISDQVSRIAMYHDKEIWYIRAMNLYECYLYTSIPIIFAIYPIINAYIQDINAVLIVLVSYSFIPISLRVLSLSRKPLPIDLKLTNLEKLKDKFEQDAFSQVLKFWKAEESIQTATPPSSDIDAKRFQEFQRDELLKFARFCALREYESFRKKVFREKKELWISTAISVIFVGWLTFFILSMRTLLQQNFNIFYSFDAQNQNPFALIAIFFLAPIIYICIGELLLKLHGGVPEYLKMPPEDI
jgi:hypothetical protein